MKKTIFQFLCLATVAVLTFSACHRDPVKPDKYTVTVKSADETMGKAYGGGEFEADATTRIWATPEVGYQFVRWNDNNTETPRNITVDGDVTYTAYFKAVGGDEPGGGDDPGGGGSGGDTPGDFAAIFDFDGVTYQGAALVNFMSENGVMLLGVVTGDGDADPMAFVAIPPAAGTYVANGTTYTSCSLVFGSDDYYTNANGTTYPHYGTALNGVVNIQVSAIDLTEGTISLTANGQLLDITTHQTTGQAEYHPFSISMEGYWQTPSTSKGRPFAYTYKK